MSEYKTSISFSVFLIKDAKPAGPIWRLADEAVAGEITGRSGVKQHDLRTAFSQNGFY